MKKVLKKYIVLGGYGEMGQVIVSDLFESTVGKRDGNNAEIWIVGHDAKKAREFAKSFRSSRVKWEALDVSDVKKLTNFLKKVKGSGPNTEASEGERSRGTRAATLALRSPRQPASMICINVTQYYFNLHVMKACLKAKAPYLDLGGLFHMTKKQLKLHEKFVKAGLTAVLGCGATPGITNVMAAYGASLLDRVHEIHVKFGGKDYTKYRQPFVLPYSAQTILDEFSMKAAKLTNGKIKMIQPMSDEEKEKFPKPVGEVTCGSILHSEVATFPISFKKKGLKECSFKAGFGDEFTNLFKLLIKLGFDKKLYRSRAVAFLNTFLPEKDIKVKDLETLRVTLIGTKRKHQPKKTIQKVIIDCRAKSIPRWNAAAGTVDTATPPSIIAQMITSGLIKKPGVFPPEICIPQKPFFRELAKRGIKIQIRV